MTFPVLHLDGTAYDQGMAHGRALGELIAENLEVYFDRFEREGHLSPDQVRERAARFEPLLDGLAYADGMRGIARGAAQPLIDVLALNMRYELLYYQFGVVALEQGCTAFAVQPNAAANGHLLLGQNWDWIPQVRGAVVHTREPDGLETLSFTEAGILGGKIGLNSTGLGLAINGLLTTADDWTRPYPPFHVRCYDILRARTLEDAALVVTATPRACSTNYLLAQPPERVVDIEAAPDVLSAAGPDDGFATHTNHFLDPDAIGIKEPPGERRPHSYHRQRRIRELLDVRRPVSIGDLEASLRDHDNHPDGVCRHLNPEDPPEERYLTVTSVVMDLDDRSLRLTDGPPCEHVYDGYSLAHSAIIGR